ncbi:MAG: SDR family NAD(P)-dependent oxidoreductase [Thermodesulfobacteriota bacterium]
MASKNGIRTFKDAVAIVTGGASGIGKALAEELATRGASVVLADRQVELAETVAAAIRSAGGRAAAAALDVTDYPAMEQLVKDTVAQAGRLDYMFNNAGIGIGGNVDHHTVDDWDLIINVNLRGVVHGMHAAYNVMTAQGFGHIVSTASMAGLMAVPGMASYCATKHAVVGLSKSLRAEAAGKGVRVSAFCPGVIRTPILEGGRFGKILYSMTEEQRAKLPDMFERMRPMAPDRFAKKALDQVAQNRAIIIVPSWWRLFWWMGRVSPSLEIFLAGKSFSDAQKKLGIT